MQDIPKFNDFNISTFRIVFVWLIVLLSIMFLLFRLLDIQVINPEHLIKEGNNRVLRNYSFEPARGLIADRFGELLAISVPKKSVFADCKVLRDEKVIEDIEKLEKIASILQITPHDLFEKIKNPKRRSVRLKQYMDEKDAEMLKALKVKGIFFEDTYERYYPTGNVNAQLIGLINSEGNGVYGVEQSFNTYLKAKPSSHKAHKDRMGHIIENLETLDVGKDGGNILLTIDNRLQTYTYSMLEKTVNDFQATSASAVLMDVKTGEILAMTAYPSFDPNDRSVFDSSNAINRPISDIFEPGSTLKPIISLAALGNNTVRWDQVFDTKPFIVNGKKIKDTHYMNYGTLSDILKYSSNTGMARIAMRTGHEAIVSELSKFGFGRVSGMGLVGESAGVINESRRFWSDIDVATLGYGYGVAVTALQLTSAYATMANYGRYIAPSIIRVNKVPTAVQLIDVNEARRMHRALETVVSEGTGSKAIINRYRIAGKTGTAKIAAQGGYANEYISSFAGFAPISNPRFAMVAIVRNPQQKSIYGGTVSAPIFHEVMTRALQLYNIIPDKG